MHPIPSAIVGVTGYGLCHFRNLVREARAGRTKILGAAVINPEEAADQVRILEGLGCRIFRESGEMFSSLAGKISLCCLPVGIPFHARLVCDALRSGCNVFVEKPLASSLEDIAQIQSLEQSEHRFAAVGFQMSYLPGTLALKRRILSGEFGKILGMKTIALSLRNPAYYSRNAWSGKLRLSDGTPVLDAPFNNAMAHQLHLGLFLAGKTMESAAKPESVDARLMRANRIDSCDTAMLKIRLEGAVPFSFFGSHAADADYEPELVIVCEKGTIVWNYAQCRIDCGRGVPETFAVESGDRQYEIVFDRLFRRISGENEYFCSTENAAMHSLCTVLAFRSEIRTFPAERITADPASGAQKVSGLGNEFLSAYRSLRFSPPRTEIPARNRTRCLSGTSWTR